MSLLAPNKKVFSYKLANRRGSDFTYKNFTKTSSYKSNFSCCNFTGATLRSASFKFCSFNKAVFNQTEFIGTRLRGCKCNGARFSDTVFYQAELRGSDFKNAHFKNTFFVCTGISKARNFPEGTDGIIWMDKMPDVSEFSSELIDAAEKLRANDYIRRSRVLCLKRDRINTLTLSILKQQFTDEELIRAFSVLPDHIHSQFYTVSYLKKLLLRMKNQTII